MGGVAFSEAGESDAAVPSFNGAEAEPSLKWADPSLSVDFDRLSFTMDARELIILEASDRGGLTTDPWKGVSFKSDPSGGWGPSVNNGPPEAPPLRPWTGEDIAAAVMQ